MKREPLIGDNVFVVPHFLPAEECTRLIERSEALGYDAATLGEEIVPQLRNNGRVIFDDPDLAASLWERARALLPAQVESRQASGLNSQFRFYRYVQAESFGPHYDGSICLEPDHASMLTFMVYLSDVPRGGATRFYGSGAVIRFEVQPEQGKLLAFNHRLLHEGAEVIEGRKYVLRSDVMYRRESSSGT